MVDPHTVIISTPRWTVEFMKNPEFCDRWSQDPPCCFHRRALILINPDISLTGPLETKP